MATIETDEITAPAYWASALVNGDESSFDHPTSSAADREAYQRLLAWLEENNLRVVDVARDENGEAHESRFTWHGQLYFSPCAGCDVLDYVVHKVTP